MRDFFRQIVRGAQKDLKGFLLRLCLGIVNGLILGGAASKSSESSTMEAILILIGSFLAGLNYGVGLEAITCKRTRYDDVEPEQAALADFGFETGEYPGIRVRDLCVRIRKTYRQRFALRSIYRYRCLWQWHP